MEQARGESSIPFSNIFDKSEKSGDAINFFFTTNKLIVVKKYVTKGKISRRMILKNVYSKTVNTCASIRSEKLLVEKI